MLDEVFRICLFKQVTSGFAYEEGLMDLNNHQPFKALRARRFGTGDTSVDGFFSIINEWIEARNWQEFVFSFCLFFPVQLSHPKMV